MARKDAAFCKSVRDKAEKCTLEQTEVRVPRPRTPNGAGNRRQVFGSPVG